MIEEKSPRLFSFFVGSEGIVKAELSGTNFSSQSRERTPYSKNPMFFYPNKIPTILLTLFSFTATLLIFSQVYVAWLAAPHLNDRLETLAPKRVALLLGTSDLTRRGQQSPFFYSRVKAAALLYHSSMVEYILASGDNADISYNEPQKMKRALMNEGVPADRIVLDYAGFSTLDSVQRAKLVFGLDSFILVSQRFHNERAVFLALAEGLDVEAFNTEEIEGSLGFWVNLREVFARLKAFLDVYFLYSKAHFLGDPIPLPGGKRTRF